MYKKIIIIIFIIVNISQGIDLKKDCSELKDCESCSLCTTTPSYSAQNCQIQNLTNCAWCESKNKCVAKTNQTACDVPLTTSCPFFTTKLIIGTISILIGGTLCVAGGVPGGGVFVPTFILIVGLSPHIAIPLSKVTIIGAAIGGAVIAIPKRHPNEERPLIYYEICMAMQPMMLLGTVFGVLLNVLFPSYLLILFLTIMLVFLVVSMFRKANKTHQEEQLKKTQQKMGYLNDKPSEYILLQGNEELNINDPKQVEDLRKILRADARIAPWEKVLSFIFVFAGFLLLILFRSTGKQFNMFGIKCGGWEYWLIFSSVIPYLSICAGLIGYYLNYDYRKRVAASFEFKQGDVEWTVKNFLFFCFASLFAGVIAGLLGVGGALVAGPFLLLFGVIPSVSVATTIFMTLFTSLSTTIQFVLIGRLSLYKALWYGSVGLFAGLMGMFIVGYLVKKYNKQSLIIFSVAFAILLSSVAMIVVQIINLVDFFEGNQNKGVSFNSVCEH
eukprot:TRINITY_DN5543_c0_g1_i1.p1 TRINITY_DN5543_c0_g1~~TRINITY_DN5543_c0_g1_i1.p1  ORF type:complete len:500 (-),score=106.34 TRINITY_DN5543_c0_g1_i1:4-1503(-)